MQRTSCESILYHHFDIEGEAFIVTPQEDDEPKSIIEALSCPVKEEWEKIMKEELEFMRTNQV